MNPQYPDHGMGYARPGDDQMMYAPFAAYEAQPPPQQQQGMYPGGGYYIMGDHMDSSHHHHHPQDLHMPGQQPSRLRARRGPGERSSLEVNVHPYMDGRMSPPRYSPGMAMGGPPVPPKSSLRGKTAEEEEARKARKREMGRERQRRKRMRDKAKREAMESQQHAAAGSSTSTLLGRAAGDRSSFASVSSYEGPSSVSTTYSNLPPMSVTISSPSHSFGMSSSGSMSDMSSPGHLSPTMAGFASDDSSWEHNNMLSNLTLSGGGDATVRASKPRAQSAALSSIAGSRRDSAAEVPSFGTVQSPAKRRKSDVSDQRIDQVGLGVNFGPDGSGEGGAAWRHTGALRRTESVPDNIPIDPALTGESDRAPRSPPKSAGNGIRPRPSNDGNYFASTVAMALSNSQWSNEIHNRLGLERADLDSMGPEIAVAFDRWRLRKDGDKNGGHMSSPPGSPSRPFTTPSRGVGQANVSGSPSTSSNNSHHSSVPGLDQQRPGSQPSMGVATAGRPPETPSRHQHAGSGSSQTSPAQPTLQTPAGSNHPVFPPHDMHQTWTTATARMYDGYPNYPIGGPITADVKPSLIPPPPLHAPSNAPMPALNSPVTVQPGVFQQTPRQAAPGTFAPNLQPPQRGVPGAPVFYGSSMPVPQGVPNPAVPMQQPGEEMLQLGQ